MANVPLMFQPLVKYVDFKGRARRSEFWLFWLFQFILMSVLEAVVFGTMPSLKMAGSDPTAFMTHFMRLSPILNVVSLALFIPSLAVGVRRMHDINRTGWWIAMPYVVMIVGVIAWAVISISSLVSMSHSTGEAQSTAAIAMVGSMLLLFFLPTLIAMIVLFVFCLLDGTAGTNRFGPDPKGRGGDVSVF